MKNEAASQNETPNAPAAPAAPGQSATPPRAAQPPASRAKWWGHALLHGGDSWKGFGAYFVAWLAAWPLLGTALFPRAETEVAAQGLDPKVVQELAPGKRVYIRTDNALGKAHALLDLGPLGIPLAWYKYVRESGSVRGATESNLASVNTLGVCMVYLHKSQFTDRDPAEYQRALLHEIRHCSDDNVALLKARLVPSVASEGDADANAIRVVARETKRPELKQVFTNLLALYPGDAKHDDVLYIDAVFNNRARPSSAEITAANAQAEPYYDLVRQHDLAQELSRFERALGKPAECDEAKNKRLCTLDLKAEGLSPLAIQRVELFREALHLNFRVRVTPAETTRETIERPHMKTPAPFPRA